MIDKVGHNCTGCGSCIAACPYNAIYPIEKDGFMYPSINPEICTKCNYCEKVCPALSAESDSDIQNSYAAFCEQKPNESSSGGAFFSLAYQAIKAGGVVYGAAFDDNMEVTHCRIENSTDLHKICGSKYIQSNIPSYLFKRVKQDLSEGRFVIFSGTPCQIKGLKLFLRKQYHNLLLIDLICHGVPSPEIFKEYIRFCGKLRKRRVKQFVCRDNRAGWNNIFKSTLIYDNGKEEYNSALANLWNRIFFSELITRESCHSCRFTSLHREGDLTLGDFWGIKNFSKENADNGISLLIVNSDKGEKYARQSSLTLIPSSTNAKEHPNLYHPTPINSKRAAFFGVYYNSGFASAIKEYFHFTPLLDIKIRIYEFLTKLIKR